MTAALDPTPTRRELRPALLVGALTVAACLAIAVGVLCAVLAVRGELTADVPVHLTAEAPASTDATLPCVEGWTLDGGSCAPAAAPDQWPGGVPLPVRHGGGLVVGVPEPGPTTALLATAPVWGWFVAGGLAGLALVPFVRTTASGRPFARGNARRLTTAAAAVALGWLLVTAGPRLAAPSVIAAIEAAPVATASGWIDMPTGWIAPALQIAWWPLPIVVLLGALAAATRRGARLAAETEGLV